MSKAKIYTRTGDIGQTSLASGQRVSKASLRLEAYGTVDELGCQLGLLVTYLKDPSDIQTIENIQRILFHVGAILATEPREGRTIPTFDKENVVKIEKLIDEIDSSLPALHSFILTSGCRAACTAHVCRSVCRRAERCIVRLSENEKIDQDLLCYVNRLSDFLFVFSRKLNFQEEIEEKTL